MGDKYLKKLIVFIIILIFSQSFLCAENEELRSFVEMGWVQPYGIHLGFGVSYFYAGLNIFWENDPITLKKSYYEYYLLGDGSIDDTKKPKLFMEEEINSIGQSVWVQIPLGVQFDIVKKNNFIFSLRQAWIISIVNIVYDKELYRPDMVFDDKQTKLEKNISHLFWPDNGLDLLSERKMFHAFYPLCFEIASQFVFNNFYTLSLGVILDAGIIEKSRVTVSFGISNPFVFEK
jgi:hypothetical protein